MWIKNKILSKCKAMWNSAKTSNKEDPRHEETNYSESASVKNYVMRKFCHNADNLELTNARMTMPKVLVVCYKSIGTWGYSNLAIGVVNVTLLFFALATLRNWSKKIWKLYVFLKLAIYSFISNDAI